MEGSGEGLGEVKNPKLSTSTVVIHRSTQSGHPYDMPLRPVRRTVADDNDCLFSCFGYVARGVGGQGCGLLVPVLIAAWVFGCLKKKV